MDGVCVLSAAYAGTVLYGAANYTTFSVDHYIKLSFYVNHYIF